MSTEDADDPLAGSRPALANSQTTPPSRSRIGLQTTLAMAVGCGVLWWIVHTVSSNRHGTNEAIRAMRSWNASERVSGIQQLETAGLGNGQMAIPPLIVALGDKDAQVRSAAAMALGSIGTDALEAGSLDDMIRGAITSLLGCAEGPAAQRPGRCGQCVGVDHLLGEIGRVDRPQGRAHHPHGEPERSRCRGSLRGPRATGIGRTGVGGRPAPGVGRCLEGRIGRHASVGRRRPHQLRARSRPLDPCAASDDRERQGSRSPRGLQEGGGEYPSSGGIRCRHSHVDRSPSKSGWAGPGYGLSCPDDIRFRGPRGGPRPDRDGAGRVERFRRVRSSEPGSGPIGHPGAGRRLRSRPSRPARSSRS